MCPGTKAWRDTSVGKFRPSQKCLAKPTAAVEAESATAHIEVSRGSLRLEIHLGNGRCGLELCNHDEIIAEE